MRTGEIVDNKMDAETEKAQAAFGAANCSTSLMQLEDTAEHAIVSGATHALNIHFHFDCDRAVSAAHDLLEDANCKDEAAWLESVSLIK